jgi:hypothetical protein
MWTLLRTSLVSAGLCLVSGCDRGPGPELCHGVCGVGTQCRDGRCIVADEPEELASEDAEPTKTRRRRSKGKRGRSKAGADEPDATSFRPVDDSHIPKYDPNRVQHIDMKSGTDRLADATIRAHLRRLEPAFNRCIETAAMHSEQELRSGSVDFVFTIEGTGKVSGVTVKAPKHLSVFGIVPCLRKALFTHRFPTYDGPATGVDYSFEVG